MKNIKYFLIVLGALVALYAKAGDAQNQLILIAGIVVLMIGIYRIAKTIPSKKDNNDDNSNS